MPQIRWSNYFTGYVVHENACEQPFKTISAQTAFEQCLCRALWQASVVFKSKEDCLKRFRLDEVVCCINPLSQLSTGDCVWCGMAIF